MPGSFDSLPRPTFQTDSRAAWVRLAIALVLGSLGSVGMWSVVVAIPTVQADFGSTRADASLAFTCVMIGFGGGAVLMGKLADRFGIVKTLALGTVSLAIGYLCAAYASTLWQFNLVHIAIGLGAAATFGPMIAEASHWFEKYRGVAIMIAASGNFVAGAIWPTIVERGVFAAGWRATHIAMGIGAPLLLAIVTALLRWQIGAGSVRSHANAKPPQLDLRLPNNTLTMLIAVAAVACCVAMAMPQVHIVAYCGDLGYGVARGAEMLSLMLACGVVSRIASGFLADRIGGFKTLLLGSVTQGLSLLLYLLFDSLTSLYVISALFGFFQGGLVPSYAIVVREAMPASEAATRVGIVMFGSMAGMSLGGWMSGLMFDATGSYAAAFINGIGWNVLNVGIIVMLMLRARPRDAQFSANSASSPALG